MKYVYPAIFTEETEGGFSVNFPDFESCYTCGDNLEHALSMAQDVLCLTLYNMEQNAVLAPKPSAIKGIDVSCNEFVNLVVCDTIEYRKFYDNKAVKKTLSIPSWLNNMAEKEEINFSHILQEALKVQLGV